MILRLCAMLTLILTGCGGKYSVNPTCATQAISDCHVSIDACLEEKPVLESSQEQ